MVSKKKFDAHKKENPGRNHGGRMDQGGRESGRPWRRATRRKELGGLSDEATGQSQTKGRGHGSKNLALGIS